MKHALILIAVILGFTVASTAAHAQSSGAPEGKKPMSPPPVVLPEILNCIFDRAWSCRHRGCLVDTRKVLIRMNTKTTTACQMRGDKCVRPMKFVMKRQRRGFSGSIAKRGMLFFVDARYRVSVAQIRRRRVFAVYGKCTPAK